MKEKKYVSIILLNYNGKKFNIPCMDSILKQSHQDFEIIFVDNVSSDGSLEEVKKRYQKEIQSKKIVIVENSKNTWFTWWNNLWVQHANKKSKYICLLNNDTTVPKDRLEELIKGIQSDKELWAVWSIILDKGYEKEIRDIYFRGKETFVLTVLWETTTKKISKDEEEKHIYYSTNLSWCALLYRKEIIDIPFPEWYFAYWEDVFFCLKLASQWYKLAYCTKSIVNHFWSGSFGSEPSDFKLFYGNRNQIINYLIFYKRINIIKMLPLFLITQIWHITINVPKKRIKAKIKARKRIINNRSTIKWLRLQTQKERKNNDKYFLKTLSHDFSGNIYYAKFSKNKRYIINIVNDMFKLYFTLFFR